MSEKKKTQNGSSLDTLAQLGTEVCTCVDSQEFTYLRKVAEDEECLTKRAKRNFIKNALSLGLISINEKERAERLESAANTLEELAADNEDKDILRSYWNMYYCSSTLVRKNGKVAGRYCKNRLCLICNSIRAAASINKYKPVFDEWGDELYFVTLTAPTVPKEKLDDRLDEMHSVFNGIKEFLRKRAQRGTGLKFEGVRKLECTYRPMTDKYHPHFHFLVRGQENAEELYNQWLLRTEHLGTSHKAQDCRKADENSALELFKYFTKIVSDRVEDKLVYLSGLNVIFKAFRKRRVFQNFGFKLPKEDIKECFISLKDKKLNTIGELQRILSDSDDMVYIHMFELDELIKGKKCFDELSRWLTEEKTRGLPFIRIDEVQDLLMAITGDYEEEEVIFNWYQDLTDWVSSDGEFLTGYKPDEKDINLVKRFVRTRKKKE